MAPKKVKPLFACKKKKHRLECSFQNSLKEKLGEF